MSKELIERLRDKKPLGIGQSVTMACHEAANEIERLQAQWDNSEQDWVELTAQFTAQLERIATLEAENAELVHDRARYGILRDDPEFTVTHRGRELSHEYLDQAVDAARATSSAAVE